MSAYIYRGDDTDAFGRKFLTLELENAEGLKITKAVFSCGKIRKEFINPVFPIDVCLKQNETEQLCCQNKGYLQIYDEQGRKMTLDNYVLIETKNKVV